MRGWDILGLCLFAGNALMALLWAWNGNLGMTMFNGVCAVATFPSVWRLTR